MQTSMTISYVLVTGATGFIGAHVVDNLLDRGFRVRAVARSKTKAKLMQESREKYAAQLDFFFIDDLTTPGVFDEALKGVDGVIHVASPLNYSVKDKEKELIIPAINGVRSLLQAAVAVGCIRRIVMTSSFGAVLDMGRTGPWTYSAKDWNPITYADAADVAATPQDAYRGSKKFAEQEAWKFIKEEKPSFDLVTLCPSMVFGPIAHPVSSVKELNESNKNLWNVASGVVPLPPAAFNFWVDVRDLADVHVLALLKAEAGGKRYLPIAPEKFNYQLVSEIIKEEFPEARDRVTTGSQEFNKAADVDARSVVSDLDVTYRSFRDTIVSFVRQAYLLDK